MLNANNQRSATRPRPRAAAGFTLLELVVVMTLVTITAARAIPKTMALGGATINAGYEAQRLASDLSHAQTLARSGGQCTRLTASTGSYTVAASAASAACTATSWVTVVDPAKNGDFTVTLKSGVTLSSSGVVTFNTLGQPLSAVTMTVVGGGKSYQVSVAAVTGYVLVR